jgi:hypothetical protein
MGKSFFDLGIPEHLPIRDVVWDYCRVEINQKGIDDIFEQLQRTYAERRGNLLRVNFNKFLDEFSWHDMTFYG